MGLNLEYIEGQTPLDDEEKTGLLIPSITTRGELDEFEQQNIEEAGAAQSFTNGGSKLANESDTRGSYLRAVKAADKGDYNLLLIFARS